MTNHGTRRRRVAAAIGAVALLGSGMGCTGNDSSSEPPSATPPTATSPSPTTSPDALDALDALPTYDEPAAALRLASKPSRSLEAPDSDLMVTAVDDRTLVVRRATGQRGGGLTAIDAASGEVLWHQDDYDALPGGHGAGLSSGGVDGPAVVVRRAGPLLTGDYYTVGCAFDCPSREVGEENGVLAVTAREGRVAWGTPLARLLERDEVARTTTVQVRGANRRVVVAEAGDFDVVNGIDPPSRGATAVALDAATGRRLWRRRDVQVVAVTEAAVVARADRAGSVRFLVLDPATGKPRWQPPPGTVLSEVSSAYAVLSDLEPGSSSEVVRLTDGTPLGTVPEAAICDARPTGPLLACEVYADGGGADSLVTIGADGVLQTAAHRLPGRGLVQVVGDYVVVQPEDATGSPGTVLDRSGSSVAPVRGDGVAAVTGGYLVVGTGNLVGYFRRLSVFPLR